MDRVRFLPNERVDLSDMEDSAGGKLALEEHLRDNSLLAIPSGRTTGSAGTSARILSGFGFASSPIGLGTATLVRGSAIMPYLDGSTLKFGLLQGSEGADSAVMDFTSTGDGTYAVYVKALFASGTFQNRVFWNPTATATEYIDNIASRDEAAWQVTFQATSAPAPGLGEWVKIWEITIASNLVDSIDDYRHFYYEGSVKDTYADEWGDGADDRDDDRTLAPITDHHRYVSFVNRQLGDMIAGGKHKDPLVRNASAVRVTGAADHPTVAGAGIDHTYGMILDASDFSNPVAYDQNLMNVISGIGGRPYVWETSGRLARPSRFFDDFTEYGGVWTAYDTGLPSKYTAVSQSGSGDVLCPTSQAAGAEFGTAKLTGGNNDVIGLKGPLTGFFVDTDSDHWRFAARVNLGWGTLTDVVFRVGVSGAGWSAFFEIDNTTHGDTEWHIDGTDANFPADTVFDMSSAENSWVLLYLWQASATSLGWAVCLEGAPSLQGAFTVASTMSGNANNLQPYAYLNVGAAGGSSYMLIDWWEMWGKEATGMGVLGIVF